MQLSYLKRPRYPAQGRRISIRGISFISLIALSLNSSASAQTPKDLKVNAGQSVVLLNLINPRPDCSTNPGPMAVPIVNKPTNGTVQMLITVTDVSASDKCPARKIPSVALIYTPNKDFSGSDSVAIDIEAANQKRTLSYRITVQSAAQPL